MKLPTRLLLLPVLCICAAGAEENGLHTLRVVAEAPAISVAPQAPGRRSLTLPSLDYVFRVEARCHGDWAPESLSLNIADSTVSKTRTELEGETNQQLELKVPATQLSPLTLRDFCVIGAAEEGSASDTPGAAREEAPAPWQFGGPSRRQLRVAATLAHASLRCSRGEEHKTVYVSQPLDVTLICEAPETEGDVAAR
jgi:hypothetical protein